MNEHEMTISVVIPAYNAAQTIGRAIQSVLAQSRPADEIIVIDDGSSDNTAESVRSLGDAVRLIQQENKGVSAARNAGIKAATGEWVAFLDADDEWMENYLQEQANLLQRNPDLVWSVANFVMCFCDENRCDEQFPAEKAGELLNGKEFFDDYFQAFIIGASGWTGSIIINQQVFKEVGFFTVDQPTGEDLDMWWRIAYRYPRIGCVAEPMAIYHTQISGSATQTHTAPHFIDGLLEKHLQLSKEQGAWDRFKPCALRMLRFYIGKYIHDERISYIPTLVIKYGDLLPRGYKTILRILTIWPQATSFLLPLLTALNKLLRIRI